MKYFPLADRKTRKELLEKIRKFYEDLNKNNVYNTTCDSCIEK